MLVGLAAQYVTGSEGVATEKFGCCHETFPSWPDLLNLQQTIPGYHDQVVAIRGENAAWWFPDCYVTLIDRSFFHYQPQ